MPKELKKFYLLDILSVRFVLHSSGSIYILYDNNFFYKRKNINQM